MPFPRGGIAKLDARHEKHSVRNVTAAFFCKQVVHNQQDAALR